MRPHLFPIRPSRPTFFARVRGFLTLPPRVSPPCETPLPPRDSGTLYGRILARYDLRLSGDGGSVRLHDLEDPDVRDIEVVADPDRPGETLWVHSYPGAPFGWCAYGAAVQLWREQFQLSAPEEAETLRPEDVRLRQALRAYREMRAMEDAAHLRAACRAEAHAHKATSRK